LGEHPDTATCLNNLAELYCKQHKYDDALALHQRSLAIREKVLGPKHPDVAVSLNNLAALYDDQGNYDKALPLYERAVAICEEALGSEHPYTEISHKSLDQSCVLLRLRSIENTEPSSPRSKNTLLQSIASPQARSHSGICSMI